MIDREKIKTRVLQYNSHLNTEEFKVFGTWPGWVKALRKGELLFSSNLQSVKMDYKNIDFTGPEINNQEWRAQLNRFLWLETCMIEDQKADDGYFSGIAVDTVNAFLKFREGVEIPDKEFLWKNLGDNTLSIAVRLGRRYGNGWWGTLPFMRKDIVTDDFLSKVYESTIEQVEFMIKNMTAAGNWRMNQLISLLFIGYIFENETWRGIGVRGINEAFHSQVFKDGCHEERTLSYHRWMTLEFSSLFYLSAGLPELGIKINVNKLIKMWEYSIAASCADGKPSGLNDELRWGYVNMERLKKLYDLSIRIREILIKRFTSEDAEDITLKSREFKSAGQWYLKHGGKDNQQFFIFDATKYGGGHCHRAVNSVNLFYGNKMLLLDPGTFNYERSDIFCDYGRRTQSHNTVCIDNLSQLINSSDENVCDIQGKCVFVHNTYSGGYSDGVKSETGSHERLLLWYKDKICIVNDSMRSSGDSFMANFNILPGDHRFDGESLTTGFDDFNMTIKPIYSNVALKLTKYEGSMEPMAGWLAADGYKLKGGEKGLSVVATGPIAKERGSLAVYALIPFKGNKKPDVTMLNSDDLLLDELADIKFRIYSKPVKYSIKLDDSVIEIVSAYLKYRDSRLHPSIGLTGDYDSDGKLALVEFKDGQPVFAYLYDGTYLKYKDMLLINKKEYGNYEKAL